MPLQRKTSLCWKQNKDLPQDLWRILVSPTPSSSTSVTAPQFSGVRAKYRILQSTMTSSIKPETQEPLQKTVVKLHYSWAWKRFLTPHQKGWFGSAPLGGVCKAFLLSFTKKYISFWICEAKPFTFLVFYSIPLPPSPVFSQVSGCSLAGSKLDLQNTHTKGNTSAHCLFFLQRHQDLEHMM